MEGRATFVIARNGVTKQSSVAPRDSGLLRFARNDEGLDAFPHPFKNVSTSALNLSGWSSMMK